LCKSCANVLRVCQGVLADQELATRLGDVSHLWGLGILDTRTQRLPFDSAQGGLWEWARCIVPLHRQERDGVPTTLTADRSENQGEVQK